MIATGTQTADFFAAVADDFRDADPEPFVRLRSFGPDAHHDLPAVGDPMKIKKG